MSFGLRRKVACSLCGLCGLALFGGIGVWRVCGLPEFGWVSGCLGLTAVSCFAIGLDWKSKELLQSPFRFGVI